MALITPALLAALFTSYQSSFNGALNIAEPQFTKLATVIKSSTKSNTYGWLGQWPGFREWVGDRVIKSMEAQGYQITNKSYESTVGVLRTDIQDDNMGVYTPMMQEMGRASALFPDELVMPLLPAGFANTCYDGQFFFDTDHPVNAEVDGSGADDSVSNVLVDAGYVGDPWYLLDTTRSLKPLIYQDRKSPSLVSMTKADDEAVFTSGEYRYGVDLRANAGYAFWQMAFGVKHTLNLDNLWTAYSAMRSFTADGGRKLAIKPNILVVPASLEKQAVQLLERDLFVDGSNVVSNELKGKFEIVVADHL